MPMHSNQRCFCGSTLSFEHCCQVFITYQQRPETAEQLMRARFSAYAIKDHVYVFNTYAASQRAQTSIDDISRSSENCIWLALVIQATDSENLEKRIGEQFVEFSAFYIADNTLCEMREKSRFVLENVRAGEEKQWRYLDGNILKHTELADVKRNEVCPCNHYPSAYSKKKGKKFKHCCGK